MRRSTALIGIAITVAAATYVVRTVSPHHEASASGTRLAAVPGDVIPSGGGSSSRSRLRELDRLIGVYEEQIRTQPSTLDLTFLGNLYIQRGRLTGDVGSYARAEEALSRALEIYPQSVDARSLLASVRFTTHDFAGALDLATGLLAQNPDDLGALAVAADAHLELGAYGEAAEGFEELAQRLPGAAAVEIRRARLAYLTGDVPDARRLAGLAERSAEVSGLDGPDLAWYRSFRAQLELDSGRYALALDMFRSAVAVAPDYHLPRAGLARSLAAGRRFDDAIRQYRRAVELLPDPSYLSALGDLYMLRGRAGLAVQQYETVEAISTLERANRQVYNRQLVVFYADHDLRGRRALDLAEAELRVRKDIYGWDALAWTLYRQGRYAEARTASDQALRLGTPDARLLHHAGMISLALGDEDRAEDELRLALRISPAFDPLQAAEARDALTSLTSMERS